MPSDRFTWAAEYSDGGKLFQIDANGNKNSYDDIDRDRLIAFEMYDGNQRVLRITLSPTQRLIWRRRIQMDADGNPLEVCHIVGKQETINGKNYQGVIGLFESDGRIEVAGKFDENHPWFYPPQLHSGELT